MKSALITGITGQDGSYLAELLLEKGYKVYGLKRRTSDLNYGNSAHLVNDIEFIYADMTDIPSLVTAMKKSQADEVYNLAAQSFVQTSWEQPILTAEVDAIGVTNMLEAIKMVTANPARVLNRSDKKGSLAVGKDADLVLFGENVSVVMTIVQGKIVYKK